MARWKLMESHYLNSPGNEWEYVENSMETGKPIRHRFEVPIFLDPKDPSCWTQVILGPQGKPVDGQINVCDGNNPQPRDIIFHGPPTPNMEPLDEEAKAISTAERPKWQHPIESLPGQGYSESLLTDLTRQLAAAIANQPAKPVNPTPIIGIDPADFAKLQEQVAALMARNAELESAKAEEPARRRA